MDMNRQCPGNRSTSSLSEAALIDACHRDDTPHFAGKPCLACGKRIAKPTSTIRIAEFKQFACAIAIGFCSDLCADSLIPDEALDRVAERLNRGMPELID